jgi:hypothetical protein
MSALLQQLQATPWGKTLGADELAGAAADTSEKRVPAGGYVCRKGEPVGITEDELRHAVP